MPKYNFDFEDAVRENVYVKLFLTGVSGSGKSYSALRVATGMADEVEKQSGKRPLIIMLNTESSRGRYYADEFKYKIAPKESENLQQEDFTPQYYIDWINYTADAAMKKTGVEPILIIDSGTPAWDNMKAQQQKMGGQFRDWMKVQPIWNEFKRTIVNSKAHIIFCARGKTDWSKDVDDRGKQVIRKLGVGSDMRDGFDYEFTCCFMIDGQMHTANADKDNTHLFDSRTSDKQLTEEDGVNLIKWANSGKAVSVKEPDYTPEEAAVKQAKVEAASANVGIDLKTQIAKIKESVDSILADASDDSREVVRGLVADTIKTYVKNSKGTPVADYRIIKDVETATNVLNALNELMEG